MEFTTTPSVNLMVIPQKHVNNKLTENTQIIKACQDLLLNNTDANLKPQWHIVVTAEPLPPQIGLLSEHESLEAEALIMAQVTARNLCRVLALPLTNAHGCVFSVRSAAEMYARSLNTHQVFVYQRTWSHFHTGFKLLRVKDYSEVRQLNGA